jgi:hypothetical protein
MATGIPRMTEEHATEAPTCNVAAARKTHVQVVLQAVYSIGQQPEEENHGPVKARGIDNNDQQSGQSASGGKPPGGKFQEPFTHPVAFD